MKLMQLLQAENLRCVMVVRSNLESPAKPDTTGVEPELFFILFGTFLGGVSSLESDVEPAAWHIIMSLSKVRSVEMHSTSEENNCKTKHQQNANN